VAVEIRIQEPDFSIAAEWEGLRARTGNSTGAVASFVGLVRDMVKTSADDARVTGLYLEHYPGMTEDSMATIVAHAQARWGLQDVVVVHRVGELQPGDQIVFVQVAAGHRAEAFAGCEYIMDYLKTDAVLWKREDTDGANRWLEASAHDRSRVEGWRTDSRENTSDNTSENGP
jgi:molybdopterin synthase catalytic subunit